MPQSASAQKKTAGDSPTALIKNLYAVHKDGNGPIFSRKGKHLLPKYFDAKLTKLIWHNIAETPPDLVSNLDFDPLFDAQDTKITGFNVGKPKIEGSAATVVVRFKNFDKRTRITFMLSNTGSGWRIHNLVYSSGHDLLKTLSQPVR